jgi:hypothetical protein
MDPLNLTDAQIDAMNKAELAEAFNLIPGNSVKRFESKEVGRARLRKAIGIYSDQLAAQEEGATQEEAPAAQREMILDTPLMMGLDLASRPAITAAVIVHNTDGRVEVIRSEPAADVDELDELLAEAEADLAPIVEARQERVRAKMPGVGGFRGKRAKLAEKIWAAFEADDHLCHNTLCEELGWNKCMVTCMRVARTMGLKMSTQLVQKATLGSPPIHHLFFKKADKKGSWKSATVD